MLFVSLKQMMLTYIQFNLHMFKYELLEMVVTYGSCENSSPFY
jgi:hypothetical protein